MDKKILFKITLCACFSALATITFAIESLFPPFFLPGARMGLSNVFILLSAIILGGKYAFITLIVKISLGSLFSGNLSQIIYSLPAGLVSLCAELSVLFFVKKTSVISASISGAVINVAVQNVIFCLVTNTIAFISYLPYLTLIGVLAGLIVGLAVYFIIKFIPLSQLENKKIYERTEKKIEN